MTEEQGVQSQMSGINPCSTLLSMTGTISKTAQIELINDDCYSQTNGTAVSRRWATTKVIALANTQLWIGWNVGENGWLRDSDSQYLRECYYSPLLLCWLYLKHQCWCPLRLLTEYYYLYRRITFRGVHLQIIGSVVLDVCRRNQAAKVSVWIYNYLFHF